MRDLRKDLVNKTRIGDLFEVDRNPVKKKSLKPKILIAEVKINTRVERKN